MIKGSEKMITFSDPLISKYYFDTQNINLKNDHKRSAMPLCKAKNRPHDRESVVAMVSKKKSDAEEKIASLKDSLAALKAFLQPHA